MVKRIVVAALLAVLVTSVDASVLAGNEYYFGHQYPGGYSGYAAMVRPGTEYQNRYFSVDATDMSIFITFVDDVSFPMVATRPFNGFFLGSASPLSFTASLASPTTLPGFDVSRITFGATDNEPYALKVNLGNLTAKKNEVITISLAPVPEPETYGMMMVGLGLIGFMVRRRRQPSAC